MPIERCPLCHSDFVVPAYVEILISCPRCATSAAAPESSSVTLLSRTDEVSTIPMVELALPHDFLAKYEKDRVIGAGACGTVYLARERRTSLPVAVKFLTDRHNPMRRARFQREIALLSKLDHPNVLSVLASGDVDGYPYLVMEYLNGGTLAGRIKAHGRLPPSESMRVMKDVLKGLEACHAMDILHRDLKPENVLFTAMGRAKLADLGLAKDSSGEHPGLTASNAMFGTPYYMSPEQIRGEKLSPASDIYSAGVVLYEMLTGMPPFTAENAWALFERHLHETPASVQVTVPYASRSLALAIDRALSKLPDARFPSAAQFHAALEAC